MKTQLRIFWLVSLLFFLTGCSGFKSACFTGEEGIDLNDMAKLDECQLKPGERVRITTITGAKNVGDIQRITDEWIVLKATSDSEPPRLFTPSQILRIEKSRSQRKSTKIVDSPEVGQEVALSLLDGSRVSGEILSVSDETIVLDHASGPDGKLEVTQDDIAWVERKSGDTSWVAPVVIILGVTLVAGGIWVADQAKDAYKFGPIFGEN